MVKQMWADPNLNDFYGRVSRIEKAHAKGYGFEARGTMGRSTTWKRERSGWRFVKPLALVLAVGIGMKGVIHFYVGAQLYEERVTQLLAGEGFDPVGGALMQADPVTLAISGALSEVFKK
jgi:hypothetical protein